MVLTRSGTGPPERVRHALRTLELDDAQRVLEIGPGAGVAASHILDAFPHLQYVAVDRSRVACERTRSRNAAHVADGRLTVHEGDVADLPTVLAGDDTFDAVFAIDVNVFWTTHATAELAAVAAVLRPTGRLWLFFAPPSAPERIEHRVASSLAGSPLRLDQSGEAGSVLHLRAAHR
jgi:SAM-dependent methyltransferase